MSLFSDGDVDPGEQGELRQAIAFTFDGPLRLHEGVKNVAARLSGLANAEADWNVVGVVFQIEGPGACGTQVPALG